MVTDIHPSIVGPHAIESYKSRMLALEEFGVNPLAIIHNVETRAMTKRRNTRDIVVESEYNTVAL